VIETKSTVFESTAANANQVDALGADLEVERMRNRRKEISGRKNKVEIFERKIKRQMRMDKSLCRQCCCR